MDGDPTPNHHSQTAHRDAVWTTRRLLEWLSSALKTKGIDSSRLCAELLLAHVIGCERMRLYTDVDRPASPIERDLLRSLVSRALAGEPVQYLVGEAWFFSLAFHVDRRVLIPRPSSETIVEHVLQHARAEPGFHRALIADVCTGSGCLAIALLKNMPEAHTVASDLSADALDLARSNAERHGVQDRLELCAGDLLNPIQSRPAGRNLHYLVANPPYIPDEEWNNPEMMDSHVRDFEPEMALRGGPDGLTFVRPLIEQAPQLLRSGGLILIEIAAATAPTVLELARANPLLRDHRIADDFEGYPRVLIARRT